MQWEVQKRAQALHALGQLRGLGAGFYELVRDKKNQYLMQGSGAFPRRSDDQRFTCSPTNGRTVGPPYHCWPGERLHAGPSRCWASIRPTLYSQTKATTRMPSWNTSRRWEPRLSFHPSAIACYNVTTIRRSISNATASSDVSANSKHFRRFAARYEKSKTCFQALVALACSSCNYMSITAS